MCACVRLIGFRLLGGQGYNFYPTSFAFHFSFLFFLFKVYSVLVTAVAGDCFGNSDQYMMTRQIIKGSLTLRFQNQYCNSETLKRPVANVVGLFEARMVLFRLNREIICSNSAWVIQYAHVLCAVLSYAGSVFELRSDHRLCRRLIMLCCPVNVLLLVTRFFDCGFYRMSK